VTLSPPVRIVALSGLLLALAAAGVLEYPKLKHRFLTHHPAATPTRVAVTPAPAAPSPAPAAPAKAGFVIPAMPPAVGAALKRHDTVVVFVYSPASPDDLALFAQARAGARQADAAFVPLDVSQGTTAVDVYAWVKQPADPETLVVKHGGRVAFAIQGATDSVSVAQAAATAR